jgi:hypothetical protein
MSPPKHDQVIEDCDAALKLDRNYVKALNRRAGALEALKRYVEALRGVSDYLHIAVTRITDCLLDFTAGTILDKFQNENTAQSVERVLKKLSGEKAVEILAVGCYNGLTDSLLNLLPIRHGKAVCPRSHSYPLILQHSGQVSLHFCWPKLTISDLTLL